YNQRHSPATVDFPDHVREPTVQNIICESAIDISNNVEAKAIVAGTKSGATALQIASYRPKLPLVAVTSSERVAQQLAIVHSVKSYVRPDAKDDVMRLVNWLKEHGTLETGDMVVIVLGRQPGVVGTTDTINLRVLE